MGRLRRLAVGAAAGGVLLALAMGAASADEPTWDRTTVVTAEPTWDIVGPQPGSVAQTTAEPTWD